MIKKRLVGLLSHAKKYIVYNVIWQWVALLAQIVVVFTIGKLLDLAIQGQAGNSVIYTSAAAIICAMALRYVCDKMASRASYGASVDVKRILREKIYEKLLRLGAAYREKTSTSEVVQLSTEGVEQLETYFGKYLPQLFYSLLAPVTLFVVLSFVNLKASAVLLICVPLIPVSIMAVQKFAKKLLNRYWGIYTNLGDSFLENLQGLTTLKIYQADQKKAHEMDVESQHFRKITMKVLTMQLNSTSVMDIIAYGGAAVGMIVALLEFGKGNIGLAGVITIVLLASEFFIPLRMLGSFFHIAMNGMAASDKIFALLDLPEQEEKTGEISGGHMEVTLEQVHFAYEADREILKGVELCCPAGSFTALVGTSGCGKSTIAGLLMGRNHGYDGTITINGQSLAQIGESSLMEHVTLVTHNSYLFQGTVEDNLRMGKEDAAEDEMWTALKQVNLEGFLQSQQGLATPVQEKGGNFSGGQCQRLALARALLHDTPMYIFDEATSNIDVESEELIMKVIHELARKKTIIMISHRLANVVQADRIYMLRDGVIIEQGRHEELMRAKGAYHELYQYQSGMEQYGKVQTGTDVHRRLDMEKKDTRVRKVVGA
ncbi:MAG: ABC transporter ATP-binding protein/permease [Lachnospiraceae bacterium]|nr:ABC transporter ATP-binding protein/permease [Lachnospiraceae bacterium]